MKEKQQIKYGAILSYLLLFINAVYGFVTIPFILQYVSSASYGVYKSIASLSASIAVVDFGLGTTMTRYIAKYKAQKDNDGANNFAGMVFVEFLIVFALLAIVGIVCFLNLNNIYSHSFSSQEIDLARSLFIFLIINLSLTFFENLFFGIVIGSGHFVFSNSAKLISILARAALLFIFLPLTRNIFVVVISETIVILVTILIFIIYSRVKVGIKPKIKKWDGSLFKESLVYTLFVFAQNIIIQFNGNVDNVLIGAIISSNAVTVYSMSLIVYVTYENLATSISNLMLPRMTKKVVTGATPFELQSDVEKAGKFQYYVLAAALGGFFVLGKDFYKLWLGDGYDDCYLITLLLIVVTTFPLVENVAISVLRAKNKMGYRTLILFLSCVINIITTIIGIRLWGYFGAAIGTAIGRIVSFLLMNIYYHKVIGFKVTSMMSKIMLKTTLCCFIPTIITFKVHTFLNSSLLSFIINVLVFVAIYGIIIFSFCLSKEEKIIIFGKFSKNLNN